MIVAIDGPAGSGKSTTAREVARRLGFRHLDSGAFYRALTHAALRAGIPPDSWDRLGAEDLNNLDVNSRPYDIGFRLFVGDEDVTDHIRSPDVNAHVSRMARVPAVRDWLKGHLRRAPGGTDVVSEGRDVGTVLFPDADLKVFLTASPAVRARRRLADHGVRNPSQAELRSETDRLLERDRMDSEREVAPLRRADDAVLLDTSHLTFDEQVEAIVRLARDRSSPAPDRG